VEDATVAIDGSVLERTQKVFFAVCISPFLILLHNNSHITFHHTHIQCVHSALVEIFATNVNIKLEFTKDSVGRGAALTALLEA